MTGPSVLQLVPELLLAAAGIGALWISRRGPKVVGGEPCCSNCGYLVRGLPGPICPECGSDLRKPGAVATAGGRRPAGKWRLALGWSAFSILTVSVGSTFVWDTFFLPRLPYIREVRQDYTLGNPASRAYDSIQIHSRARGAIREGQPDPAPASIRLQLWTSKESRFDLEVDTKTLAYRDPTAKDKGSGPLNATALLAWLRGADVQGDPTQLAAEMNLVIAEVQALQQTGQVGRRSIYPAFSSSTSSGSFNTSPLPFVARVPVAAGLLVWLIGIVSILTRNPARREIRAVTVEANQ